MVLSSDQFETAAAVPLDVPAEKVGRLEPPWGRFVAAVVAELRPAIGFVGTVASTVPVGAGLSSSAALEVAVAVALGASDDDPVALALVAQRAEHAARGVPTGIMDQLACVAGREGHAVLIDCTTLAVTAVPLPADVRLVVLHSGQARDLASSAYAERRRRMRRRRSGDRAAADRRRSPMSTNWPTRCCVTALATSSRRTPAYVPPSKRCGATTAPPSVG